MNQVFDLPLPGLRHGLAALLACFFAYGCAKPPPPPPPPKVGAEVVVVLPGADGHIGGVVVRRNGEEQLLDQPYASSRIDTEGKFSANKADAEIVQSSFSDTLTALPGKPATFMFYFLDASDELTPESKLDIDKVFSEIKLRPLPDVLVVGHTDTFGSTSFNDRLSLARAARMRQLLIEAGLSAERIEIAGRGERELRVPTPDNVREQGNRRVEVNVR